jgi:hypothetical protein
MQCRAWLVDATNGKGGALQAPRLVFDSRDLTLPHATPSDKATLAGVLGQDVAAQLMEFLSGQQQPVLLFVDRKLPDSWQAIFFEMLIWQGMPLIGKLITCQHVDLECIKDHEVRENLEIRLLDCLTPVSVDELPNTSRFLNLFPDDDLPSGGREQMIARLTRIKSHPQLSSSDNKSLGYLNNNDLSENNILFLFIHGRPPDADSPQTFSLTNPAVNDSPWSLPENRSLPAVLILLSCGYNSVQTAFAQKLLQAGLGCQCVLAADGELSADQALGFVEAFWPLWLQGKAVGSILAGLQKQAGQIHAAARLRVFGRGELSLNKASQQQDPEQWSNARLLQSLRQDSRQELLWRILFLRINHAAIISYRYQGDILEETLSIDVSQRDRDPANLLDLEFLLESLLAEKDFMTISWVIPMLIYLAEHNRQSRLEGLKRLEYRVPEKYRINHSESFYNSAKGDYRKGQYHIAMRKHREGLHNLQGHNNELMRFRHLGQILAICNDLLLQSVTKQVYRDMQSLEFILPANIESDEQVKHRKDTRSRYLFRQGELQQSFSLALERQNDTDEKSAVFTRENCNLVYLSALDGQLANRRDVRAIIEQWADYYTGTEQLLEQWREDEKSFNQHSYVLRALALWLWQTQPQFNENQPMPENHQNLLNVLLELCGYLAHGNIKLPTGDRADPGPLGFFTAFMLLMFGKNNKILDSLWQQISVAMENKKYFAELTGLYFLLADKEKAGEMYRQLNDMRRAVLVELPDKYKLTEKQMQSLQTHERTLLASEHIGSAPFLCNQGWFPI